MRPLSPFCQFRRRSGRKLPGLFGMRQRLRADHRDKEGHALSHKRAQRLNGRKRIWRRIHRWDSPLRQHPGRAFHKAGRPGRHQDFHVLLPWGGTRKVAAVRPGVPHFSGPSPAAAPRLLYPLAHPRDGGKICAPAELSCRAPQEKRPCWCALQEAKSFSFSAPSATPL